MSDVQKNTRNILILIVEDEAFLAKALQDNLQTLGYASSVVFDGEEALERIKTERPDLILLDLLLPKRDGFYVLTKLKENPEWAKIPTLILSNLGGDADIKRALELGADDYLVKSQHSIDEVLNKISGYFSSGDKSQ